MHTMNANPIPGKSSSPPSPARQVIAAINVPEDVAAALNEFTRAGFAAGDVVVLAGRETLRRLSAMGFGFGFSGRLISLLRRFSSDIGLQSLARQTEELRAGHALVGVCIRQEDERRRAEAIFMRCHGHFISNCRPWAIPGTDSPAF